MSVRVYPKDRFYCFVDMDGVIADFDALCTQYGLKGHEFKLISGVYSKLPVIPGAVEAIKKLESIFNVFLLTKIPSQNPSAATEKLLWVREHFPSLYDRVIITSNKGCFGTVNDFLIDDHPEWANVSDFPGTIIHFKGDWDSALLEIEKIKCRLD